MFTHAEMQSIGWLDLEPQIPKFKTVEFEPIDFKNKGEDYVQIFIGDVADFTSVRSFWVSIVQQELPPGRWLDEYLAMGYVQPFPVEEYESKLRRLWPIGTAQFPTDILAQGQPTEICQIWVNHCDEVILASFPDRYIAMRWYSTA